MLTNLKSRRVVRPIYGRHGNGSLPGRSLQMFKEDGPVLRRFLSTNQLSDFDRIQTELKHSPPLRHRTASRQRRLAEDCRNETNLHHDTSSHHGKGTSVLIKPTRRVLFSQQFCYCYPISWSKRFRRTCSRLFFPLPRQRLMKRYQRDSILWRGDPKRCSAVRKCRIWKLKSKVLAIGYQQMRT